MWTHDHTRTSWSPLYICVENVSLTGWQQKKNHIPPTALGVRTIAATLCVREGGERKKQKPLSVSVSVSVSVCQCLVHRCHGVCEGDTHKMKTSVPLSLCKCSSRVHVEKKKEKGGRKGDSISHITHHIVVQGVQRKQNNIVAWDWASVCVRSACLHLGTTSTNIPLPILFHLPSANIPPKNKFISSSLFHFQSSINKHNKTRRATDQRQSKRDQKSKGYVKDTHTPGR